MSEIVSVESTKKGISGTAIVHKAFGGGFHIESFFISSVNGGKIKLLGHELEKAREYGFETEEINMTIEDYLNDL